ncbi:allophanate hydrolase subunit 1 [Halobacillus halophilus]|uniref:Allophanate hydrolase subunit 1 n=1 Tax=Halobacillus halophilus (strain ATCC 35676 / DSM 2266 / JCM 20832 / KCTC 3685 / LMG 17431 / NBRC 102448 / NCIMB 2269) TaxID=866895 RepID=I0JJ61_HALH3|nr:5-oxoprolinase subunit PxpB [Halobacillus halophilus]ASF38342.1 allophanate hydrolase subunit 1 [Halobacillus halophilus]CCG44179.1 allophanate hydrolase subunit 1 [Halobacillus halophilus DSM 2266]
MNYHFQPLGDQAVVIDLGNEISQTIHEEVQSISKLLEEHQPEWMIEYIPAFTNITILYSPLFVYQQIKQTDTLPYDWVCDQLRQMLTQNKRDKVPEPRTIEIPICYGGKYGPDLSYVAEYTDLKEDEVINRHMNGNYIVYMIGFAPGFPYIGGMDETISTPRRDDPRLEIPAGSVGIAGSQTGVYPITTPGGWQLIGQTPLQLFQPEEDPPSLLQAGDKIKFTSISEKEYLAIKEGKSC